MKYTAFTTAGASQRAFLIGLTRGRAFNMADWLSQFHNGAVGLRSAFTMAEILLSLTIIGVVAAITLPSLTGNINERTWNTQRKALYARFSQAIALMPSLNGYGTLTEETDSAGSTSITDTAAETLVTSGLAKVLKINNICDNEHLEDCGITQNITTLKGTSMSFPNTMQTFNSLMVGSYSTVNSARMNILDTKAAAFETQNGESIAVFYNPQCEADMAETVMHYAQPKMCVNFVYDLNGNKGPNTVGKDIGFITALYSTDPVIVAPMPLLQVASSSKQHSEASKTCTEFDNESRLPNRDELSAMFYNKTFLGNMTGEDYYWSGSIVAKSNSNAAWAQYFNSGIRNTVSRNGGYIVHCIKR